MEPKHEILVVEDDPQLQQAVVDLFSAETQIRVRTADSGESGLAMAVRYRPDLMLLDVMMPGLDGFEVCQAIRSHSDLREMPVVMLTALADRASRLKGIESGADDFISKPFDFQELRARVGCILRLNRYRKLMQQQARFQWLVEGSEHPTLLVDSLLEVTYSNAAAKRLLTNTDLPGGHRNSLVGLLRTNFTLEPVQAWENWIARPEKGPEEPLLMARRGAGQGIRHWYRFAVQTDQSLRGETQRAVHLVDITHQMAENISRWSFERIISHKLRTPLTGLLGCMELLSDDYCARATTEDAALWRSMQLSGQRLADAVANVLRYVEVSTTKAVDGSFAISRFAHLVGRCAESVQIRQVQVEIAPELQAGALHVSEKALNLIIGELCANAAKFHPERNPTVQISVRPQGSAGMARIEFMDDGVHLAPEELSNIWRPYFQVERHLTGEVPGVGLGLPLLAAYALQFGGAYEIHNRIDRPGLVISCTLPWSPSPGPN